MSSEVERRLEAMLADAPEPDQGAGEEALHRALQALRPAGPTHRGLRTAGLVVATVVVLLVIAAGSLAAAGALHVTFGAKAKPRPATTQLTLPRRANGIAAIVDGRLSVTAKGGHLTHGPEASAVALSPRALYVAAGTGHSIVAMAPDGRRAWSHPAGGRVVAIAWAPDGFQIAYIVDTGPRFVLHVIYGNGIHDTTIDRSVRAVRPSWQADSLALAYVGGGGRAVVYDLGHQSRRVVPVGPPVTGVAFAPTGEALAVKRDNGVWLMNGGRATAITKGSVEAFGWLNGRLAVATPAADFARVHSFSPTGGTRGSSDVHGIVLAVTPKLVIVRSGRKLVAGHTTLLTTRPGAALRDLQVG
jgi:hypothetical protein